MTGTGTDRHSTSAACSFGCGPADESNKPPGGLIVVAGCPVHAPALNWLMDARENGSPVKRSFAATVIKTLAHFRLKIDGEVGR